MTCPGIGGECGLTFGQTRTMFQGLFQAPRVVNGAVKGAVLCGKTYEKLGFDVCPKAEEPRSDIIQAVKLETPEALEAFCRAIQAAAPVDSHVTPIPLQYLPADLRASAESFDKCIPEYKAVDCGRVHSF